MQNLIKAGRAFYGIGIAGIGIQQFIYSEFRPVLLPYWPNSVPAQTIWAYVVGAVLILAGAIIAFTGNARTVCILLGVFFSCYSYAFMFTTSYSLSLTIFTLEIGPML
jgi:uncharacterized membrane protein